MNKALLLLTLLFAPAMAGAEVLDVPRAASDESVYDGPLPDRGASMATVEKRFGEPRRRLGPVGGASKQQPPITRWDYNGFYVVFENNRVIDAVIPDAPPPLHHTEQLERASNR